MTTVPSPLPVPGAVFGESPYNTRQQFYVNALVTGTDPDTGQVITRWVTAESDVELTADDWDAEITRAATWGATGTRILRPIIRERRPYRRARL